MFWSKNPLEDVVVTEEMNLFQRVWEVRTISGKEHLVLEWSYLHTNTFDDKHYFLRTTSMNCPTINAKSSEIISVEGATINRKYIESIQEIYLYEYTEDCTYTKVRNDRHWK